MADTHWQRLPKARRAAVYRGFGRAIRDARDDHDQQLAADMRIAFEVLRTHAKAPKKRKTKKR
ncbi:MAG: hypothetical protein JO257_24315 [Deltaproteobacteria bacterium]|nr:hypothetical protein [Deltaproteobacteria bacterium]